MIPTRDELAAQLRRETGVIDAHTHVGVSYKMFLANEHPYALSFEDLALRMERQGIERSIVFPRTSSFYLLPEGAGPEAAPAMKLSRFPYEIENANLLSEIYEIYPEYAHFAIPFVFIDPSRHVAEQARWIETLAARYPVCGMKVCTSYHNAFVRDLDGPGTELLDLARRRRFPILLHSSYDPKDPWAQAADIVDLARRHPDVTFCLAHAARFIRTVLDEADRLDNCYVDLSAFTIHCGLAQQDNRGIPPESGRFPADYHDPAAALASLVRAYPDTLLWGTDTPCYSWVAGFTDKDGERHCTALKSSYEAEATLLRTLDGDEVRRISRTNPLAFLLGRSGPGLADPVHSAASAMFTSHGAVEETGYNATRD